MLLLIQISNRETSRKRFLASQQLGHVIQQQMQLNHVQRSGRQAAHPVPPALPTTAAQGLLRARVKARRRDLDVLPVQGGGSAARQLNDEGPGRLA